MIESTVMGFKCAERQEKEKEGEEEEEEVGHGAEIESSIHGENKKVSGCGI